MNKNLLFDKLFNILNDLPPQFNNEQSIIKCVYNILITVRT